jgi:Zn-dependent M28 family amino/carboxypeptidase
MKRFLFLFILLIITGFFILLIWKLNTSRIGFNAHRAFDDVKYQVDLGPRTMGSVAHEKVSEWIIYSLQESNWQVETQEAVISGQHVKNIIAKRGNDTPWIILGSHYDSRALADRDPDPNNRSLPVPGADDGASTVAILLEMARVIPEDLNKQIWLVFFDNEDNGDSTGKGWSVGADYFVSQLEGKPDSVVILDMLGDRDLNVYMEKNSNQEINSEIWRVAKELGYTQFKPISKYSIIDDHIPFIKAGIQAVDLIDIDYSFWHTTQDTLDKISADSLKVIGDTILKWLEKYPQ